ncbi:uncharacterized protein LOC128338777 [Hemicordylus capensis]|uniref:uncharacterized protein LOC128338777 n=1 Tax=Hemicordylus capensis TaxID=884348 RepID=UPI0023025D87|nr:uncharacterized protein LOC128338777 [Hemicordylus capensis]
MICFRRKTYLATAVCLVGFASLLVLSYLRTHPYYILPRTAVRKGKDICKVRITNSSITVLSDNRTFIIAPYLDEREVRLTRVIGIVHHSEVKDIYCSFCCSSMDDVSLSKAVIDVHSDRFGFPYATADLLCLEPTNCYPHYISLHWFPKDDVSLSPWFEIRNRRPEHSPVEFTVCISTMFGEYNNVLQFIQSVEMYKLLGVQKVVIYKNSCSPLMEKVLAFYTAEKVVEIVPWPIEAYLNVSHEWRFKDNGSQIGYYGQIAALNDCVYRNMYKSKYVLLNDIDEIILPVEHPDWKTMMQSLQKEDPEVGVFLFENHIFPNTVFTSDHFPSWNTIPGVNILQHILREPDRKEVLNPRKMIVNPRKVIQTSVHSVLQAYGSSVEVPMDIAIVYHCRTPLQANLPKESLIKDTTLWRYQSSLILAVSKVQQKIPL